jgi:hypothetical protein
MLYASECYLIIIIIVINHINKRDTLAQQYFIYLKAARGHLNGIIRVWCSSSETA